jgi:hypothetical protein
MSETKEVERTGGSFAGTLAIASGKSAEPQQFGLLFGQLQRVTGQSLRQHVLKAPRI